MFKRIRETIAAFRRKPASEHKEQWEEFFEILEKMSDQELQVLNEMLVRRRMGNEVRRRVTR